MNLELDPADLEFREGVRAFLSQKLDSTTAERNRRGFHTTCEDKRAWTRILAEKGWSGPAWPIEYGGPGWTDMQVMIFEEECFLAGAPLVDQGGFKLLAPVVWTYGTEEQKRRFLEPTRRGDIFWGQGFSEPNAGSDLASLTTRAVRDGDEYVVNGHKIWTSDGHFADYIFALVKTDPEAKSRGISFIVFDARAPGVTIRPIVDIGEGHCLNEIFIDDVRVPAGNLIGEENRGWSYGKFLLDNERAYSAEVPRNKLALARLKTIAAKQQDDGRRLIDDPVFASRMAQLEAELAALEYQTLRALSDKHRGTALPIGSILKIRGSELIQKIGEMQIEALGEFGCVVYPELRCTEAPPGPDYAHGVLADFMYRRSTTIYGGTNEIQRTIIAKSFLGL
jgi:alkylation response protein AidB-like acyl-CoA dehydrogenase